MLAPITPVPIQPMRTSPGCMRAILAPPRQKLYGAQISPTLGTCSATAPSSSTPTPTVTEPPRPLHRARAREVQGPRAPRRGDRRHAHVGVRRPPARPVQRRRGDRPGRPEGERRPRAQPLVDRGHARRRRTTPKVRLEVLDECGIDAQIIFPNTVGLGGQDLGMIEDEALCKLVDRDLQRLHGRDPGRLGQPSARRCR